MDRLADEADRAAGRTIGCPTMMLWSTRDDMVRLYGDPLRVWEPWCPGVVGSGIDSGHHMAEEAPAAVTAALRDFLKTSG